MKVSLQSAQSTTSTDITSVGANEIIRRIGAQLGAIEEVIDWGALYVGIVVAKVIMCEKHPNADKLSVCLLDDGGVTPNVSRNENGYVQVVCGAPNVKTGLMVVWLPPGATVPSTYGNVEPFVLGARELRGVTSNGMIASPSELGISDDHSGILELEGDILPGTAFSDLFQMNDTVIDLENKMFTHRPDCFGTIGIARELAGIQHIPYVSPQWYIDEPVFETVNSVLPLTVESSTKLVPRFSAIVMRNISVKPSPTWLQADLTKIGIRPINNIVDITNWLMHMTAQPLHAYDYDKITSVSEESDVKLVARMSQKGEQLSLLNGKTIIFEDESTILISTGKTAVGIGGIMGGAETEVDNSTKNIIIEAATFDMYSIRRSAMKYGLFTDAVTRFNKGQSPLQTARVLAKAVEMAKSLATAEQASELLDYKDESVKQLPNVQVQVEFINQRLGTSLDAREMKELLTNVEFGVDVNDDMLDITIPFWRRDIRIPEDIVEEVGRLYGYDRLPITLPTRSTSVTRKNAMIDFKNTIRNAMTAYGASEVLSYSFVHKKLLESVGQNSKNALQLSNAISPDLQYFRLSIMPSLLEKVHMNIKSGYGTFALYEIGKAHSKKWLDNDKLPIEAQRLALVFAADAKQQATFEGEPYYQARVFLDALANELGVTLQYEVFSDKAAKIIESDTIKPFLPARSAIVRLDNGDFVGVVGEFNAPAVKATKLPSFCAGFELELEQLLHACQASTTRYVKLPKFPKVSQDITLAVAPGVSFAQVRQALLDGLHQHCPANSHYSVHPLDIYQANDTMSYTFRLNISDFDHTMTAKDVNDILDLAANSVADSIGATRK